ncbi:folate family ECF transporter S component [Spiroplasma endosymbiont of Amphibalanus improvisus]|uniref:folate family ECF transporter S component n=1 Tax=Spiroplasma endosymbiont of Amphibalanus improvisus TaxID=3066327 RepID=UPI00313E9EAE
MFNLIANIISWIFIIILAMVGAFIDKKNVKNPSIFALCLMAMFVAMTVLLTNLISYSFAFFGNQVQLNFGQFILFISGMLFGPFYGVICGICSDSIGAITNIKGAYSSIFTLDAAITGFAGSAVFFFRTNKYWYWKMVMIYCAQFFLISFFNDEIWLWIVFGKGYALSSLMIKLIKYPIECLIYTNLTSLVFLALFNILDHSLYNDYWCYKNGGRLTFKKSKKDNVVEL